MSRPALLDVNLLIALFDPDHVHHDLAHDWFADNRGRGFASRNGQALFHYIESIVRLRAGDDERRADSYGTRTGAQKKAAPLKCQFHHPVA